MASSSLISRIVLGTAFVLTLAAGAKNYMNMGTIQQAREEAKTFKDSIATADEKTQKADADAKAAKEQLKAVADAKSAAEAKAVAAAAQVEKAVADAKAAQAQVQEKETQVSDLTKKLADAGAAAVPARCIPNC